MIEPAKEVDEVTFQLNWLREHEDANPLAIVANQRNRAEEHESRARSGLDQSVEHKRQADLYGVLADATQRYHDEAPSVVREKWRPFP
jgi:hypothetical protein